MGDGKTEGLKNTQAWPEQIRIHLDGESWLYPGLRECQLAQSGVLWPREDCEKTDGMFMGHLGRNYFISMYSAWFLLSLCLILCLPSLFLAPSFIYCVYCSNGFYFKLGCKGLLSRMAQSILKVNFLGGGVLEPLSRVGDGQLHASLPKLTFCVL